MTVLAAGDNKNHALGEGKRRAIEALVTRLISVPRAQKNSHTLLYKRARHGTTQAHTTRALIHSVSQSVSATPHRERSTACHVWHMGAHTRVPSRLTNTGV